MRTILLLSSLLSISLSSYGQFKVYSDGNIGIETNNFHGNVNVDGNLAATSITQSSDYRLKENITSVSSGSLENVLNMNVVQYNYKQREYEDGDTATGKRFYYDDDSPILKNKHYGLIAQELQKIYPDLVLEGDDGYLSINYIELIPILINSIQELKGKLDGLQGIDGKRIAGDSSNPTGIDSNTVSENVLYQNTPNPFTESTLITCTLKDDVKNATLYIYDLSGKQMDSVSISERGSVGITIEGHTLDAGMYLYTLVADGNIVDSMRMILTK